jgi:hypothetical protein
LSALPINCVRELRRAQLIGRIHHGEPTNTFISGRATPESRRRCQLLKQVTGWTTADLLESLLRNFEQRVVLDRLTEEGRARYEAGELGREAFLEIRGCTNGNGGNGHDKAG